MEKMETWSVEKIRGLFDLTGKVAVVTGGSGALGQAAAKALAAYGASVVITSRKLDSLEAAAEGIAQTGSKVLAISCDATIKESVDAMMAQTISGLARPRRHPRDRRRNRQPFPR